jgi:hypothetical protein
MSKIEIVLFGQSFLFQHEFQAISFLRAVKKGWDKRGTVRLLSGDDKVVCNWLASDFLDENKLNE